MNTFRRRPAPPKNMLDQGFLTMPQKTIIPHVAAGNIRIIPLGGIEEIGMNMSAIEMNDEILVIDAGLIINNGRVPGADYIIPNTNYLKENKSRIKGLIVTHGHLDHIGAIPYIMDNIGNPPIYTRNLSSLIIKKRQAEFPHTQPLDFRIVEKNDAIKIGNFSIQFFGVSHTIPDAMGIAIQTPHGYIVNPGDFKLDHVDGVPTKEEEEGYAFFNDKKVLLLMGESTNIESAGFSTPERLVLENLETIIRDMKGRLIIGMFATHFLRMARVIEAAEKFGKKVVLEGRSIRDNVDLVIRAGILPVKKGTIISIQESASYPPDKVVVLATGAQGDEYGALMRMAMKTHKHLKLNDRDTVLLSASVIMGNETAVDKMKDGISELGASIMHYRTSDLFIHSTGHANREELKWLHRKLKPKFFVPIHGTYYRLKLHAELAMELGMPKNNIVVAHNGTIIEIQNNGESIIALKEKASHTKVSVDGFMVGDVQEAVINDRKILSKDGMFIAIIFIDAKTGRLKKSPDIISRGLVFLRESQEFLRECRHVIKAAAEKSAGIPGPISIEHVRGDVSELLSRFIFQTTAKSPIVIPVVFII